MILTIDTEKERPERLRQVARFLEGLAQGQQLAATEQAEDFSFSEEAFSTTFDEPEKQEPPKRSSGDDFRVQPY